MNQEADIWTITKAIQLLTSNDIQIATISSYQLRDTRANIAVVNNTSPVNDFISDQTTRGLYAYKYKSRVANLWTRTRLASQHLQTNIDVSDAQNIEI